MVLRGVLSTEKDLSSVGSKTNTDHTVLDLALGSEGCCHVSIGTLLQNDACPDGNLGVIGGARLLYPIVHALQAEDEQKSDDTPDNERPDFVGHPLVQLLKPIEHRIFVAEEEGEGQPDAQLPPEGQLIPRVSSQENTRVPNCERVCQSHDKGNASDPNRLKARVCLVAVVLVEVQPNGQRRSHREHTVAARVPVLGVTSVRIDIQGDPEGTRTMVPKLGDVHQEEHRGQHNDVEERV